MTPELSVVIPTLGRSPALPDALKRLRRQSKAPPFEVLVVADAKADDVDTPLRASRPGASAARNLGLREAAAPVVLFLGDDILARPDLVARHAALHRRLPDERVAVLGHVVWGPNVRITPFRRWLEHGIQCDYRSIRGDRAGWGQFYTTNVSVKRDFALGVGGFDEEIPFLYEDLDLARRLHDRGLDLRYDRRAWAEHDHPASLENWQARMEAIGRAERVFAEKHPDFEPYFRSRLRRAAEGPPARGRGRHLATLVPQRTPWLGPRVWASAEAYYAQRLWPAFRRGYEDA